MGAKTGAAIEEAVASAATPPEGCALITGSSRGIGAAIATELAGAGWPVAVNYRADRVGAERIAAAVAERGGQSVALEADVSRG